MPFTKVMFTFIQKKYKCCEKDEFEFEEWLTFLECLKMIQEDETVREELIFDSMPT